MPKKKTPAELVDSLVQALYEDLKSSYQLAMEGAQVNKEQIDEVQETVADYVTNNWF